MSAFVAAKQAARMKRLCRKIERQTQLYFRDATHRAEFEEWYLKKYGEPYEWVPMPEIKEGEL